MTRLTQSMKSDYPSSAGPAVLPPDVGNR